MHTAYRLYSFNFTCTYLQRPRDSNNNIYGHIIHKISELHKMATSIIRLHLTYKGTIITDRGRIRRTVYGEAILLFIYIFELWKDLA
jgi:hypothetical protein